MRKQVKHVFALQGVDGRIVPVAFGDIALGLQEFAKVLQPVLRVFRLDISEEYLEHPEFCLHAHDAYVNGKGKFVQSLIETGKEDLVGACVETFIVMRPDNDTVLILGIGGLVKAACYSCMHPVYHCSERCEVCGEPVH